MVDERQQRVRRRANMRLALALGLAALGFYLLIWYLGSR